MPVASLTRARLVWLVRRLSRIYPAEIPYRMGSLLRTALQRRGRFEASTVPEPATDANFGKQWARMPHPGLVDSRTILAEADGILTQGLRVFDVTVPLNHGIPDWNRDPKTGIDIPREFGLSIDFRHIAGGVDIKYLWELNRHVWWVTLAQAHVVSGEAKYLDAFAHLLDSWLSACPYPLGANWSSPVEHGIRLINWSIVWHLIGGAQSSVFDGEKGRALLARWLVSIYQHIRFASDNYSFYSSADNHLIGEAAGVFVGAHTWDRWSETRALRVRAKEILEEEIAKQFATDGVNLEQAFCYHKFSLEFLLASLFCGEANRDGFSPAFLARMLAAIEFMAAMTDCSGRVPPVGDSDDGKVFSFVGDGARSPYESMLRAGAALFDSPALSNKLRELGVEDFSGKSWLAFPDPARRANPKGRKELPASFEEGGYVVLGAKLHSASELRITMDAGPLGYNRISGHGHADALAVLLSYQGKDFLVDPGTYCYNAAPELRKYFRGTSAHNTVVIDGVDQSIYGGSFLWLKDVNSTVHRLDDDGDRVVLEASHDGYLRLADPVRHVRKLTFDRNALELTVEDRFECSGPHSYALHWHFSPDCRVAAHEDGWLATREIGALSVQIVAEDSRATIMEGEPSPPLGWASPRFYEIQPTQVLVIDGRIAPGSALLTRFKFLPLSGAASPNPGA